MRGLASASVRSDSFAREREGVPVPRHQMTSSLRFASPKREKTTEELTMAVEDLRKASASARERWKTERRAHAKMLAEERAVIERLRREVDDGQMHEANASGRESARRRATHTTHGAVLDRRYVLGLSETTPNAMDRSSVRLHREKSGVSTTTVLDFERLGGGEGKTSASASASGLSGAPSLGAFSASSAEVTSAEVAEASDAQSGNVASPEKTKTPARVGNAHGEDVEVLVRTTPFSDRVDDALVASARKGRKPEDATPY